MAKVLITAFEPYDRWTSNASWLCLVELTRDLPAGHVLTTRRYPVDFALARSRLEGDLAAGYDFAIHMGQAPGSPQIRLEAVALNVGHDPADKNGRMRTLAEDGPTAYRSDLPLDDWAAALRAGGIPAAVSYHAGTYLCNAMLYWSRYLAERLSQRTRPVFVHLPLDLSQAAGESRDAPSLPVSVAAAAIRLLLAELSRL
jgi:pyroglutamyl-peptidase